MENQTVTDRLKELIDKKFGGNASRFAKAAGLKSVQSYIERGSLPNILISRKLAQAAGVSLDWLATGREVLRVGIEEQRVQEKDGYSVPLVKGALAAGTGAISADEVEQWLWLPKEYLRTPASYECRYAAIRVSGNSMEPILEDGEIVVIDRAERDLARLGERSAYAVRKDHENAVVKHLKLIHKDNILELISANAQWVRKHGFEYLKMDEVEENPIIGKVVFSFRRWK